MIPFLLPSPSEDPKKKKGPDPGSLGFIQSQRPASALLTHPTSLPPRNPAFPSFPFPPPSSRRLRSSLDVPFTLLQPCVELCTEVDRMCPSVMGFRCPLRMFGGGRRYAFGYEDWVRGVDGSGRGGVNVGGVGSTLFCLFCSRFLCRFRPRFLPRPLHASLYFADPRHPTANDDEEARTEFVVAAGQGGVDGRADMVEGRGVVGTGGTSDRWGNVWCAR